MSMGGFWWVGSRRPAATIRRDRKNGNSVFGQCSVGSRQCRASLHGLRNEHSVERIAMKQRQAPCRHSIIAPDGEPCYAKRLHPRPSVSGECNLACVALDLKFPDRGDADEELFGFSNHLHDGRRQAAVLKTRPPEQHVTVQKQLHVEPARFASSRFSKLSLPSKRSASSSSGFHQSGSISTNNPAS